MTSTGKKTLLALTLSISAIAGCSKAPAPTQVPVRPGTEATIVKNLDHVTPAGGAGPTCPQPATWNAGGRFIAFTACRSDGTGHRHQGSLFLWDEALQDAYVLNGALAGLNTHVKNLVQDDKTVEGMSECESLDELNPLVFADGKVLFSHGQNVYVYDMVSEERVTVAYDGQSSTHGGPRATITGDGHLLAYIGNDGTVVLKETDGVYYTKTRGLTKIAAEAQSLVPQCGDGTILDLALSGDGTLMVLNINGVVYAYDVAHAHLYQVLPLGSRTLAGMTDGFGHVAISHDGRFVAATVADQRLLVYDRQTTKLDTVPFANMGLPVGGQCRILDPRFCNDSRGLLFETRVGGDFRVWKYDVVDESLRGLAILNNALGEQGVSNLVSQTTLDP